MHAVAPAAVAVVAALPHLDLAAVLLAVTVFAAVAVFVVSAVAFAVARAAVGVHCC